MHFRDFSARALATLTMAALFAVPALAQDRGGIRGSVSAAESKAAVAGARVSIANPARVAIADEKGAYIIRDLPVGAYDVVATAVGREPMHTAVTVTAGKDQGVDIVLKAGSLMLSSVVVSATNTPVDQRRVAATVNTLTPEQVRTSPARETQDMLREIPGVELPRTSSQVGGTAQIVSIRGVDEGRTAVLLDGFPINDAWGEWIDWSRAPKGSIDHVEVLEGGGANLYGNGAMGGVISLFSRPVSPGSYRITLDGGSRDAKHGYASVGLPAVGPLSLALTGDYGDGGGYKLIADPGSGPVDIASTSIRRNGTARLDFAPAPDFSAFLSGHLFSDDRHLGTPLTRATRTDGETDLGLNYGKGTVGTFTARAWDREMRENNWATSLLTVSGVARSSERVTAFARIPTYDRGASLSWSKNNLWGFQTLGVGGDYRYMGGYYDEQDFANNAANAPTTKFNSGGNQSLSGVYVSGVLAPAEKWLIEVSARVDSWGNNDGIATDATGTTTFPDATRNAFSPRVGIKYLVTSTLSLHTAFYQAFRAPNLAELYRKQVSATTITIPNPSLKPEYATGYEFGLDWQPAAWVQFKGTVYQANYRDFNTFVTTPAVPPATQATRTRLNVQKSRSLGGEGYIAIRPVDQFVFSASLNYDDARVSDLGPVAATATVFKGARIGRVPIQKATVRAEYDSPMAGTFTAMGRYEGSNTTLGNSFTLPEFSVVDVNYTSPQFMGVSAFFSIENIFDRQYYVSTSAGPINSLALPRTLRLGIDAVRF